MPALEATQIRDEVLRFFVEVSFKGDRTMRGKKKGGKRKGY